MATSPSDRADQVRMQLLEAIRSTQDAIVEAIRRSSRTARGRLPELPDLPLADRLPRPEDVVDNAFGFAEELLATQREFAERLVAALNARTTPRRPTAKKTTKAAPKRAKKAGAKKTTKKRTAKKRPAKKATAKKSTSSASTSSSTTS